jgi:DNA-binding CsgD family transcriptional regulator
LLKLKHDPNAVKTAAQFAELLELIYQASTDAEAWNVLGVHLGNVFQSTTSLFIHNSISKSVVVDMSYGFEESYVESYKQHYVAINPLIPGTLALPSGKVARMFEAVPEEALKQTEYYNEWLVPQGFRYSVGAYLSLRAPTSMFIAFHRHRYDRDFSDRSMALFSRLMPHFERALHISGRLNASDTLKGAQFDSLDELGIGVIRLDRQCSAHSVSPKAERLIKQRLGLSLRFGRLVIDSPDLDRRFRGVVARVIDERVAYPVDIPLGTGGHANGIVIPLHHSSGILTKVEAILLIKIQEVRPAPAIEALSTMFRLTQAEIRLLNALAEGQTISDYSQARELSRNTVKSQLQSLFTKTGVSRQADLVRLAFHPEQSGPNR